MGAEPTGERNIAPVAVFGRRDVGGAVVLSRFLFHSCFCASTTTAATSTADVREADYLLCPSGESCGK